MSSTTRRVALVTGGARRIGEGISRALVAAGYHVMVATRLYDQAGTLLVGELGERCAVIELELSEEPSRQRAIAATLDRFGSLDLLVNNAAVFPQREVDELDLEHWQQTQEINLTAPYALSLAAIPALRETRGSIVNICDVYAERPAPRRVAYSVSKAGLVMLTRALALELAPEVRVNGVSPGPILFPVGASVAQEQAILERTPLGRAGASDDIAAAVLFLAQADYVTGQVLAVDGGRSLVS